MGHAQIITQRSALTAQALATMGADSEWDRCLRAYLAWDTKVRAQTQYGAYDKAMEAGTLGRLDLESRFGKGWMRHPDAQGEFESIRAMEKDADDAFTLNFTVPFWKAARDLVLTPAPSLAAALFKAAVIEWEEVWNDSDMTADCVEILDADLARFVGEAA
ncbi:hypothetical protein [Novosphingobium sp.]|uniref:hypothetical protein n=1 Tax=Novosphingobium sp. TaxID=1874826 RepID=UPI002613B1ED|nr:hypothetical protein [Novosphingobium sp.]